MARFRLTRAGESAPAVMMPRAVPYCLFAAALACCFAGAASAELRKIGGFAVEVERMASRLDTPWGIAFLPGCEFLVTERDGALVRVDAHGIKNRVSGAPRVVARGQGGLLDVEAARDFPQTRDIFLTYSVRQGRGSGTALATARLSNDGRKLENLRPVFEASPGSDGHRHYGSRVVETSDGLLFVTIGDRGDRETAQEVDSHNGTIVRIRRDGTVPPDNPFYSVSGVLPEIWSFGHRNPQGAALDQDGNLWTAEHGARGGDEINFVQPGRNFGWPVISYGVHYSGGRIGEGYAKDGMEQPEFYWDPSIAPSGLAIYSGKLWPDWKGQLFVGSLKFDYISRLEPVGGVREIERIDLPETKRVRDVQEAPDGTLWFIAEDRGAVYRILPAGVELPADPDCQGG